MPVVKCGIIEMHSEQEGVSHMFELYQLIQLIAIAECGTISRAAEQLHLSQPALSRSMQKLEDILQVTLFDRQKNKITLNKNGKLAVEQARRVVRQAQDLMDQVRAFDRSQRTISIGSCAPAPLWELVSMVSQLYPEMTVSSEMKDTDVLLEGLQKGGYQFIILPFEWKEPEYCCFPFEKEQLYFSLPPAHPLSGAGGLYFKDIDGESILLFSQIGFWREVCRKKMPLTRALVQTEQEDFRELVQASALPSFVSDLAIRWSGKPENRVVIPVLDPEATAVYHFVCRKEDQKKLSALIQRIKTDKI